MSYSDGVMYIMPLSRTAADTVKVLANSPSIPPLQENLVCMVASGRASADIGFEVQILATKQLH